MQYGKDQAMVVVFSPCAVRAFGPVNQIEGHRD